MQLFMISGVKQLVVRFCRIFLEVVHETKFIYQGFFDNASTISFRIMYAKATKEKL
jgi:hypothetical protein